MIMVIEGSKYHGDVGDPHVLTSEEGVQHLQKAVTVRDDSRKSSGDKL